MSVKADILKEFDNQQQQKPTEKKQKVTADDILSDYDKSEKKKVGGEPSKVSSSGTGVTPTQTTPQPIVSESGGKEKPKLQDWSIIENVLRDVRDKSDKLQDAKSWDITNKSSAGEGMFDIHTGNLSKELQKDAQDNLTASTKQRDVILKQHQEELLQPIKQLIDSGEWKNYVDPVGNFKYADAIKHFDGLVKGNKGGNYLRDQMVTLFKQAALYEYDDAERQKMREEEYTKSGIDISKYGPELLKSRTSNQYNELESINAETKARGTNLLQTYKPKLVEIGRDYDNQAKALIDQYKNQQISEEDANKKLQELKKDYATNIGKINKDYQTGINTINHKATAKYARINEAIQRMSSSITGEEIYQSIPKEIRDKIEKINNDVEGKLNQQRNVLRQGLDVVAGGLTPMGSSGGGLLGKSTISGWYSGLANIGNYLSMQGYDNSFVRYLQGKQYEADVNAPAEYTWKDNALKRSITSTGTSLGASLPIMAPATAITLGSGGLGLPEVVSTVAAGLTSYYGEKAQNTGQVYQELLDKTGDASKAYQGAKEYEDKQLVMMPLYFLEGAGLQNLLKGKGIKKALIGGAQELAQELPTEYWQNYTEAQQVEGFKGSFGSYIKEHPETALDIIVSTVGQAGAMKFAGKTFSQINDLIKNPKAQYYADIIGKHGIDFAMANLQHQFNTGVIDEATFQSEQEKLMLSAKKLKEYEGLGLKGEDAKAYFSLTENANRLKKAIGETDDEGLRIGFENELKQTQSDLDNLVKGKGAYAIFTLPGGGDQTKIAPLSHLQQLEKDGKLGQLIYASDGVQVIGDDKLNQELQERKRLLGVPEDAPEGFYTYKPEQKVATTETEAVQTEHPQLKEATNVINQSIEQNKLKGIMADQAKVDPIAFMKMIADQAHGVSETGEKVKEANAEYAARDMFGDELVDKAKEMFPLKPTKESIQQQATNAHADVMPILQRMNNADYINENELNKAADHLYNILDQVDKSDLTDEQKQSSANLIEPLIQKIEGYEFRTKTETSTTTEAKTASIPTKTERTIRPALEQSTGSKATITSPDGSTATGTLNIKSGQYVLDIPQGQQRVIGEKAITDRDLTLPTDQEMDNPIKFDKDGNVQSITVKDRNGNLIEIHDPEKALDMAIQLRAEAIGEVPSQLFDNTYEEVTKEISEEKLVQPPSTGSVGPTNEANLLQSSSDSINAAIKMFGDDTSRKTLLEKGFDNLSRQDQLMVMDRMRVAFHDDDVIKAIIKAVPVDVMNNLVGKEWSTQSLSGKKNMLLDSFAIDPNKPILSSVGRIVNELLALTPRNNVGITTNPATESGISGRGSGELNTTSGANEFHTNKNNESQQINQQQPTSNSPKSEQDENKTEKTKAQETEGLREGRQNVASTGDQVGKEGVSGSEPGTPLPPSDEGRKVAQTPRQEDTAIRKEKLEEVKAVKKMFEANAERKKWADVIESALNNLQERYPDSNLYDAARQRIAHFAALFDNKIPFNPTTEDLAVAEYFKAETEKAINDIQGWDSVNDAERIAAVAKYKSYNDDLVAVAKAINPSEAGRAFGFRQSEMRLDPEYGLQVRRMQLLDSKNGERLTPEEQEWAQEMWDQERELWAKEQELMAKGMKEEFDKKVADLKKQYDQKSKQTKKEKITEQEAKRKDDYLKQKGKDIADRIRKGKDLGGGLKSTIPLFQQAWGLFVEGVAKLVEAGYTVADAIDKHIKDNKINKQNEDALRNRFNQFVSQQIKNEDSLSKISELAKGTGVTSITSDMVSKNLIKDFVDSYIGEVAPESVLETATSDLEKALPGVTKDKLIDAYLKQGEFHIPSKQKLETQYDTDKRKIQKLVNVEKELADLKNKKDIYRKQGNKSSERSIDKSIDAKERELKKALSDIGTKVSGEDKFSKAENKTRAQAHNDRMDSVVNTIQDLITKGDLSNEQIASLNKIKGQLEGSKIKLDENSKTSQKLVMDHAENELKKIKSDFDRSLKVKDMSALSDIRKGLQQALTKFNSDKEESEQNLKLQRTKDNLERSNRELQRKINAGEYNDEKAPTILKKNDAELIKLQIQRNQIESKYREKQKELVAQNKSKLQRIGNTIRGFYVNMLIGAWGTAFKVFVSGITKPNMNAVTKGSFGQIFRVAFPEIYKAAKAGGESSSWKSVKASYTALLRQVGEKKLNEIKDKLYEEYDMVSDAYNSYKLTTDAIKEDKGEDSKEYKAAQNELQRLKGKMDESLLNVTGAFIYDFIGGSSLRDALDALLYRSNKIEKQFGFQDTEKWGKGIPERIDYVMSFIGRSHGAMKTFSARSEFAAGFIARVEHAINEGIDVNNPDKILEIAHESYLDWDRGKYQQSNFISDSWNNVTVALEDRWKGTEWEKYSKTVAAGLKWDIPITRVPINILHEAVMEYTLGLPLAIGKSIREYYKAKNIVINEQGILPNEKEFREAVKNQVSKMDAKQAATIARAFRKGGFGTGLYAFAAITGLIAFGGFYRKGQGKKKEDEDKLSEGQIMLGDEKLGKLMSKTLEHIPAMYPVLFGQNLAKVMHEDVEKGKTTTGAVMDGALANLEAMIDAIPQSQLSLNPVTTATKVGKSWLKQGEDFTGTIYDFVQGSDVDDKGNIITRKPISFEDHIKLLKGDRQGVLTEANYKDAMSIIREYNKSIKDLKDAKGSEDQIEKLIQQRDEQVQKIYELNENK